MWRLLPDAAVSAGNAANQAACGALCGVALERPGPEVPLRGDVLCPRPDQKVAALGTQDMASSAWARAASPGVSVGRSWPRVRL